MNRNNERVKRRKRPSPFEKGVSSYSREPFLASKKRPLHLQIVAFTPLSIRRGGGGEASSFPLGEVRWGLRGCFLTLLVQHIYRQSA